MERKNGEAKHTLKRKRKNIEQAEQEQQYILYRAAMQQNASASSSSSRVGQLTNHLSLVSANVFAAHMVPFMDLPTFIAMKGVSKRFQKQLTELAHKIDLRQLLLTEFAYLRALSIPDDDIDSTNHAITEESTILRVLPTDYSPIIELQRTTQLSLQEAAQLRLRLLAFVEPQRLFEEFERAPRSQSFRRVLDQWGKWMSQDRYTECIVPFFRTLRAGFPEEYMERFFAFAIEHAPEDIVAFLKDLIPQK